MAAVGDLHYRVGSGGLLRDLFAEMSRAADVAVLAGDLTDHGRPDQARVLADDLTANLAIPAVAVLGNHDVESGAQEEITRILEGAGVTVLDGDCAELEGIGFAGTKGFCGGFGRATLEPWGEQVIKAFVEEALKESLKLENGLAKLRTGKRVAILHYAPIRDTVEGEFPEIIPFLGSIRLAEPIDAFAPSLVLHGHAHHGSLEGKTAKGVPVFNCALPLRKRADPAAPYFLAEL